VQAEVKKFSLKNYLFDKGNQLHVSAKIHNHHQTDYENKKGDM
jgi:hypothetical protein